MHSNWTTCERCGNQVLIDPSTEEPQPCAHCQSKTKKGPLIAGTLYLVGMIGFALSMLALGVLLLLGST